MNFKETMQFIFAHKDWHKNQSTANEDKLLELVKFIRENLNNGNISYTLFDFVENQPS